MPPAVAIIGASADRTKYGNKAVRAYRRMGYEVYPIHPQAAEIEGEKAYPSLDAVPRQDFERVSFYVPPAVGLGIIEQVARKHVDEVWLNPGAESNKGLSRFSCKIGPTLPIGSGLRRRSPGETRRRRYATTNDDELNSFGLHRCPAIRRGTFWCNRRDRVHGCAFGSPSASRRSRRTRRDDSLAGVPVLCTDFRNP